MYDRRKVAFDVMKRIIISMRPEQWYKNLIVYVSLIFMQGVFDVRKLLLGTVAFFIFCFLSGSIYLINDIMDKKEDENHPYKSQRPIAHGSLPIPVAIAASVFFAVVSLVCAFFLNSLFGKMGLAYFLLLLLYSFILKKVIVIDVITVVLGFVLRAIAGAALIQTEIHPLLVLSIFFFALFLIMNKRKHDLLLLRDNSKRDYFRVSQYNISFLNSAIVVSILGTGIVYFLYVTHLAGVNSSIPTYFQITTFFVFCGMLRYAYLMDKVTGEFIYWGILRKDNVLILTVALWIITIFILLYVPSKIGLISFTGIGYSGSKQPVLYSS